MILVQKSTQRRKRNDLYHCHLSERPELIPQREQVYSPYTRRLKEEDREVQIHIPRVGVGMIRRTVQKHHEEEKNERQADPEAGDVDLGGRRDKKRSRTRDSSWSRRSQTLSPK